MANQSADIADILKERQVTHGHYNDNAEIMQRLKMVARSGVKWDVLTPMQKESIEMICHKLGRILSGDPDCADHWDDIAGYAKLWNYSSREEAERIGNKLR